MNVRLTPHAAELLEAVCAQRHEPAERILEHALEILAREEHVEPRNAVTSEAHGRAVSEMLDFIRRNRVRLGAGLSVKDLIYKGHSV